MSRLRRLKHLLLHERAAAALLPEAFWRLLLARIQLLRPFAKTAPRLGVKSMESPEAAGAQELEVARNVTRAIRVMSRCTPWKSTCMVRAVAGLRMLEKRGIESTLYMGVARDRAGKMVAHAWLRSGEQYVSGDDAMQGFVVVEKFAKLLHAK